MKSFSLKAFPFFIILSLLFIMNCDKKTEQSEISYPLETAKMVSHVTSGMISSDDIILVRFVAPIVKDNLVGQIVKKSVFSFKPNIDGLTHWKDAQTLIFKPNATLPFRQEYSGILDLNSLIPKHGDKNLEPLEFTFYVAGRELVSVTGDFKLQNSDDPVFLTYEGKIIFTETTKLEVVKRAVLLRQNSKKTTLSWDAAADGKTFNFWSPVIERTASDQKFELFVDKNPLKISQDYRKDFILPALSDLSVTEIIKRGNEESSSLVIKFSDELDPQKDIRGLIRVEPQVEINPAIIGKEVHLSGDFKYGTEYTVHVNSGIRSRWGTVLQQEYVLSVLIEDIKPQMRFASDGIFLPSANQQKLNFMTVNLKQVRLIVQKVFESNIGQFLQTERIYSARKRFENFNTWELDRVGVDIVKDTLEIGFKRNTWLQHELDLNNIIPENEKGLFLISLTFEQKDMLFADVGAEDKTNPRRRRNYGRDYYNDPLSPGYIYRHGRIYKPVILSDIGLTYKKAGQHSFVLSTNILDTSPMSGVKISLLTYQNQIIAEKYTDSQGIAEFEGINQDVFLVLGEKNNQRSVIKLNDMAWNISGFDTGGEDVTPDGLQAFIYTERGVYRPGDEINISLIARNREHTFPNNHPVTLQILNPKNQLIYETIKRESVDGFYHFPFRTGLDDLTGNWQAKFLVGSKTFQHTLKIETVAPYRLKVNLKPEKYTLDWTDRSLTLKLVSNYLFGNPAAGLNAEVNVALISDLKSFDKFKNFKFTNSAMNFRAINTNIFQGTLDSQGTAQIHWSLPSLEKAPSGIRAIVTGKVFEKGGRPNQNYISIPIDPFPQYIGLQFPSGQMYTRVGTTFQILSILVNPNGNPVTGKTLYYKIYKNSYYWWWEYDNRRDFRLRYKNDRNTRLVQEGSFISQNRAVPIEFTPEDNGEYLIEVFSAEKNSHTAGMFFKAYHWGQVPSSGDQADILALKSDKEIYNPGETAMVSFPTPQEGKILVSVEKSYRIISTDWFSPEKGSDELQIPIPITEELVPNAYVSVAIIQSHNQTVNDRPIRMYGILPISVTDPFTKQEITISTRDEFQPNKSFDVAIQTTDHQKTQFTVAVVDEGLLGITQFKTPDPFQAFFKKQRLGVQTYDLFSQIINANKGDIFKTFSIGGDISYRETQLEPEKNRRFVPVSMFKGPMFTDDNGFAKITFDMPNYVGSVRVMVVNANRNRFGSSEKTVPVKTDLMILPSLPRVLGPEDKITVPVTVFAMKDNPGDVNVSLRVRGPAAVFGESEKTIPFTTKGEKDVDFEIQADAAVGIAKIEISAKSGRSEVREKVDLAIRPSSPRIYETEEKECKPGETISFQIPGKGLAGTNEAKISIRRRPNLNLTNRLMWLIRYPYGCIEQTVSAVFPQLFLKRIIKTDQYDERDIDFFINEGIIRLRKFQLPSGAFSYWPGNNTPSAWGTNYGGHFLIEAKKLGYNVPNNLLQNWLRYQKSQALTTKADLMVRVYRVYLLALAGEPQIGAMNLLKDNNLKDMNDTQKWLLASAYKLAGVEQTAWNIVRNAAFEVKNYQEFSGTYGSGLRDKAMILETIILFERWENAKIIAEELARYLSSDTWYSTQTTSYMLLALGKYFHALGGKDKSIMVGKIQLPNGESVPFTTEEFSYNLEILKGFGKRIEVNLDNRSTVKLVYANLEWNGVPLKDETGDLSKNLQLTVEWLDEDGMTINPLTLPQGKTFWGHFRAGKATMFRNNIEELALVQVLPAGWEIENIRLSGEDFPGWMSKWNLNQQEYVDIRDDRIMWFFDMPARTVNLDFVVKLNAVTKGEFRLPPTLFETMYDNNYKAKKAGMVVRVVKNK